MIWYLYGYRCVFNISRYICKSGLQGIYECKKPTSLSGLNTRYLCILFLYKKNIWKSATFSSKVTYLLGKKFYPPLSPPLSFHCIYIHQFLLCFTSKNLRFFLNKWYSLFSLLASFKKLQFLRKIRSNR